VNFCDINHPRLKEEDKQKHQQFMFSFIYKESESGEILGHNQSVFPSPTGSKLHDAIDWYFFIVFDAQSIRSSKRIGNCSLKSRTSSTGSSVTTLNMIFSVRYTKHKHIH
jgi:hypothetical protein